MNRNHARPCRRLGTTVEAYSASVSALVQLVEGEILEAYQTRTFGPVLVVHAAKASNPKED